MTDLHHLKDDAGLVVPATEIVEITSDSGDEPTALMAHSNGDPRQMKEAIEQLHSGKADETERDMDQVRDGEGGESEGISDHLPNGKIESEGTTDQLHNGDLNDSEASGEDEWESESLYADALEGMGDQHLLQGEPETCTLDEAQAFRKRLRDVGADRFVLETIEAGTITAKKLCTAFGIRPPAFLEGSPDEAYLPLLALGLSRELSKRLKLPQYNTIDDVVALLHKSKNIIVLTGAGISTSLGIPDFRSKETGLYSKLEHLGLSDPQEVFDIEIFREDPSIFYSIARDILPPTNRFSPTHAFIALLQAHGKLLTNFSQNIDNLEAAAGVHPDKLIQCHGSFATASCIKCRHQVPGAAIFDSLKAGEVARCARCLAQMTSLAPGRDRGTKRKRGGINRSPSTDSIKDRRRPNFDEDDEDDDDEDDDVEEAGVMKPDITFFGEDLPATFHSRLADHDRDLVDLVIVIGTSLKVAPVSEVVGYLPKDVPQVYISRTPVSHIDFDVDMLGDSDVVVAELCRRAGWSLTHEMIPPAQTVEVRLQEGFASRYAFTAVDPEGAKGVSGGREA